MKKLVLSFITLMFSVTVSNAQSVSSIDLGFNKLDQDDAFIVTPGASFDFNNHSWVIGPSFLYSFGDQVEERKALKLTGIVIGYNHFIHGKSAKWNLFHSFDFIAQRIKDEQESQFFDTSSGSFIRNEITQIDNNIFLSANAGFLLNFNDRFSLTQTIGIGANTILRKTESTIETFSDTFIKPQWSLKTSIKYNLSL